MYLEPIVVVMAPAIVMICMSLPVFICMIGYFITEKGKRARAYDQLIQDLPSETNAEDCVPVRYASAARFASWLKFFPWELCGVLVFHESGVAFRASFAAWRNISLDFDPATTTVEWNGRTFMRNGALSWAVVSMDGEKHYFSTETGATVFGSRRSTRELYERLLGCLGGEDS